MGPHYFKKSECANHAMKCYCASLEKLVEEKSHYKGKLTELMKKKLTKAARCAIKMNAHSNKEKAVKLLGEDLQNGPYHCFGDHNQCNTDYCKVQKK